jgi:uncharacterized SAM-binding protein YcdF (DUF218 family)
VSGLPDPEVPPQASDREIIAALDEHRPIGEQYARTGEVPVSTSRQPAMDPSPGAAMQRDATPVRPIPRPPRFVGRFVLRTLILVLAVIGCYFLVTLWQVWSTGRSDEARPVDAIVVLGAAQYDGTPSPQLAARLDHAVALWQLDLAPRVIVTGGKQPLDRFTEAQTSAAYLIAADVPADAILLEPAGRSTYESLAAAQAMFGSDVQSVLIVTDPYHALRSRLIAEEVGFDAYVSPADQSVVTGTKEFRREVAEAVGVGIGRLIGFDRLDDLTD